LEGPTCPFIRKLASSGEWQQRYRVCLDSNVPIVPSFLPGVNDNTVSFLHYLEFYKKLYELPEEEQPPEHIINNPILCDEWLRVYISKMKQKQRQMKVSSGKGRGKVERESITNFD